MPYDDYNLYVGGVDLRPKPNLLLNDHKKDPQMVEGVLETCGHMHHQLLDNFPSQQPTVTYQGAKTLLLEAD